jgi:hypothetical protein
MGSAVNQGAGGCQCGGTACVANFSVRGCGGVALPGAVATLWDSSSKIVSYGSATSNSIGGVSISLPTTLPSYYLEIVDPSGLLATFTGTISCGDGITVRTLSAATGQKCMASSGGCPRPMPLTLYFTSPYWGAVTLTWTSAFLWSGNGTVSYPGSASPFCPASTVDFKASYSNGSVSIVYYNVNNFTGGAHFCPGAGSSNGTLLVQIGGGTRTCEPLNHTGSIGAIVGGPTTFTVTQ